VALAQRRTTLFADTVLYASIRTLVVPLLRTYPFVRIWQVGCSTGEDVYTLGIVLHEEGLLERCKIYATDTTAPLVDVARAGRYDSSVLQEWKTNYVAAGGTASLEAYTTHEGSNLVIDPALRKRMVFAQHNMASDSSFNDFHLIVCRSMTTQYKTTLQWRVHQLLYQSLVRLGFLALGRSGSLKLTPHEEAYREVDGAAQIHRRVR